SGSAGRVAAGARQTRDQAAAQGIGRRSHDDGDVLCCCLRSADRRYTAGHDDIDFRAQEIANQRGYRFDVIATVAKLVGNVAPFDITEVAHPAHEFLAEWIVVRGSRSDVSDARGLARLLRPCRQRPRCCAAGQRDELAPLHSITSSASASSLSGMVRPSALAVLRLITNSNLVDCTTGRSAGFSPLRIRPA